MRNFLFKYLEGISTILYPPYISKKGLEKFKRAPQPEQSFIFSLFDYSQREVKQLIRYLKKHEDLFLKKTLGDLLYREIHEYLHDQQTLSYFIDCLVLPVPTSQRQRKKRGFNQTELLAFFLAQKNSCLSYKKNVLKKKDTAKQALIHNRSERFKNVRGAFSLAPGKESLLRGRDVIIVDDLTTTGATLLEIEKLLKKNGARKIIALTLAH